jgi:threonine dehydratase
MTVSQLVSLSDIQEASKRIRPTAHVTPLIEVPWSADAGRGGASGFADASADRLAPPASRLWLKCESLQPMGAFKIRGALNMLAQLPREALDRGVITYSSGNHGQGVALAARVLGAPAVIVMPTTAPRVKVDGVRGYGAEVQFAGTTSLERKAHAEAEAASRGLTIVPPFDHPWIIAGQGTAGLEILDQLPSVGTVYVPIGGGGILAGIAAALKLSKPSVRVVGVEPAGAAKMSTALAAGHPVTLPSTASIADGLLPVRPGDLTFQHTQEFVDEVVTVTEEAIADAVAWLFRRAHIVAEPSGAATTAAVREGLGSPLGEVVAVVSGGNVEAEAFARYVVR